MDKSTEEEEEETNNSAIIHLDQSQPSKTKVKKAKNQFELEFIMMEAEKSQTDKDLSKRPSISVNEDINWQPKSVPYSSQKTFSPETRGLNQKRKSQSIFAKIPVQHSQTQRTRPPLGSRSQDLTKYYKEN